MRRKLSTVQIQEVCLEVLHTTNRPSVRYVMAELQRRFGSCGRTERVAEILRAVTEQEARVPGAGSAELSSLLRRLSDAEARAARAEALERHHQDFWAARYQDKLFELTNRTCEPASTAVPHAAYLQLYRKATELARRLARYEEVGSFMEPPDPPADFEPSA